MTFQFPDVEREGPIAFATLDPPLVNAVDQGMYVEWMDLKAGYEFEQHLTGRLSGHPDSTEARRAIAERCPAAYSDSDV